MTLPSATNTAATVGRGGDSIGDVAVPTAARDVSAGLILRQHAAGQTDQSGMLKSPKGVSNISVTPVPGMFIHSFSKPPPKLAMSTSVPGSNVKLLGPPGSMTVK